MPKKHLDFRLSEEAIANLQKYTTAHSLANMTEALEQILTNLLSPSETSKGAPTSGASDLFPCNQRRTINNIKFCIIPATLSRGPKTIEIPSPLVCEVCQSIRRNLPSTTLQTSDSNLGSDDRESATRKPSVAELSAANSDPSNSTRKNSGMTWCPDGGFWVFQDKCDKCKTATYTRWYECQIEKLREKGELQRQNTASKPS